jgi:DHA1 family bicyclomycin/chloramphenicol resistance-like MFS transporter
VGYGFLGLVVPTTAVLALEEHGALAGTASALMGTLRFMVGAMVMAVVGLFLDGTARPMVAGITASALLALGFSALALRGRATARPTCAEHGAEKEKTRRAGRPTG